MVSCRNYLFVALGCCFLGPAFSAEIHPFGFRGVEIFKLGGSSSSLAVTDLNGDELPDLVVANNDDATVRLFYQRQPGEPIEASGDSVPRGTQLSQKSAALNEIPSDARFRIEKFFTESHITSLVVGDFDNDGRPDLAYYSDPPELTVVLQAAPSKDGDGSAVEPWGSRTEKFALRDGVSSTYSLAAADLDGDERDDLVLLAKSKLYVLYQGDDGLRQPESLTLSFAEAADVELADINHDGRQDLVLIEGSQEDSVAVRLQGSDGFGPEIVGRLRALKSWFSAPFGAPLDGTPEWRLLTVQESTDRLKVYRWAEKATSSGLTTPRRIALGPEAAKGVPPIFCDVDRNGRTDLVLCRGAMAELEVRFQDDSGLLARTELFPTLAAVNGLQAADVDGDGHAEVVVTSAREKAIGVSFWRDGRLQIPRTWPLKEEPLRLVAGGLRGSKDSGSQESAESRVEKDRVFVVFKSEVGFDLDVFRLPVSGTDTESVASVLEPEVSTALAGKGGIPSALRLLDVDGDSRTDVMVFVPYEAPYLYLQQQSADTPASPEGEESAAESGSPAYAFKEISREPGFGLGQLSKVPSEGISVRSGDDGRDLLAVAVGPFVRTLRLDDKRRMQVVDQLSAPSAGARIAATARINVDEDPELETVLLDSVHNSLEVYDGGAGEGYKRLATVELPKMQLVRLTVRDLDGDGRPDLAIVGRTKVAVLYARATEEGFDEVLTYNLEKKDDLGAPFDLISGDLNGDGAADLVVSTAPRYHLLFFGANAQEKAGDLDLRLAFPIFEEKTYMRRGGQFGPREMVTADIDRDGLNDLLLLIHDRVLLYLQDAAP